VLGHGGFELVLFPIRDHQCSERIVILSGVVEI
jgi:hypothetical protein